MAASGNFRLTGAVAFAAGLLALSTPASAEGIFQLLFGGFTRPAPPANLQAYADPSPQLSPRFRTDNPPPARAESGPATAFCVRTCDGHFFPVQAHTGVSAAEACRTFCPASTTRLYSGASIDRAVASDGSRYSDLDAAFLYRQHLVAGCTCNGRNAFGLAHVDVNTDPTLRPGDVVATKTGLQAFTGMKNKVANFTPVQTDRKLPKSTREKLSGVKIMPPNPGAPKIEPVTLSAGGHARHENRSAQLAR